MEHEASLRNLETSRDLKKEETSLRRMIGKLARINFSAAIRILNELTWNPTLVCKSTLIVPEENNDS